MSHYAPAGGSTQGRTGQRGRGRGRGGGDGGGGRGGGRGRGPPPAKKARGPPSWKSAVNLDESFCMEIHAALQALVEDGKWSAMSFPPSYDNSQRCYIHSVAEKYGLFSKSSGKKADGRFVHVAKVRKNAARKKVSLRLPALPLNASTVEWFPPVVREYMARYPTPNAGQDPWSVRNLSPLASAPKKHQGRGGAPLFKPLPGRGQGPAGVKTVRTPPVATTKLPVYGYREQILELVDKNQLVVLSADTGCGKSTQIPQFLLDDALARGRGEETRIICTQPRRISALSLSERVARERAGHRGGDPKEVGHAIRFDSSYDAKRTKLIFCTTGTLLKWLNNDPLARGFSHIILDEVHERDQFTDFLLILFKTLILKQRPDLKVILMSATIQVEKFSRYFQPHFPAPVLNMVGGTNFPVTTLFLEDVLALLERDRSSPLPIMDGSRVGRIGGDTSTLAGGATTNTNSGLECPLCGGSGFANEEAFGKHVATCFGEPSANFGSAPTPEPEVAPTAIPVADMGGVLQAALSEIDESAKEALLSTYMKQQNAMQQDQAVDYDVLLQLLSLVNRTFPLGEDGKGAILVFLPGWEEISFMERALLNSPATSATYEIALLHSRLSAQEQRRAFMTPPHGKRKLVLATNIAETSLTIEDVVFVVDCGKSKQVHALAATSSSSFVMGLQTTWVARANCVQRTGRAGRVRAGICFRLFSKARYENAMKEFMLPELLTSPLEELLLQIKLLQLEKKLHIRDAKEFLMEAMDAPSDTSIDASLQRLVDMRALANSENQALTLLGWHLGHICSGGVSVQMAKLLLWGHTFGCFDAILQTTCALSGYRDPFISFLGMSPVEKGQVDASKKNFARHGSPPSLTLQSDHFVLWKAFEAYLDARAHCSFKALDAFCARNKLHRQTLEQLVSIYKQLHKDMDSMGLSPATQLVSVVSRVPATVESVAPYLMALSIGMYPNALFTRSGGVSRKWTSKERVKVKMDGSSMVKWTAANSQKRKKNDASGQDDPPDEWLVYHEMMQSELSRLAKYGTKLPSPLLQALLMGSVESQTIKEQKVGAEADKDGSAVPSKCRLVLDDWLVFEIGSAHEARWVALLRERLHAVFLRHLERLHAIAQRSGSAMRVSETEMRIRDHDAELLHVLAAWVSSDLRRS